MTVDLTKNQSDYAIFLPALSSFYSAYVGKERFTPAVGPRIPAAFQNGMESFNFFNDQDSEYYYKWALYSAGHADLDVNKVAEKEDMVRNRDRNTSFILGDSGGFQIGKGVWEGDWDDPNCPQAMKKKTTVLEWMDKYMDYGMMLDIPGWTYRNPEAAKKTGIYSFNDALTATTINAEYFINNRTGECKFLNVLQGESINESQVWYDTLKKYSDPIQYPNNHFNGWSLGGKNVSDAEFALTRIVNMHFDGLLIPGTHDWLHALGISKLEWAIFYTEVQRAVRHHYNHPNFVVSFDCASPFLATANGQIYIQNRLDNDAKWSYRMQGGFDDKKYATDTRSLRDTVLQDNVYSVFEDSLISQKLMAKDVCIYAPGDLNKIGKEGRTSWDSFSYFLLMSHNVNMHIRAVQDANHAWDSGLYPKMLFHPIYGHNVLKDALGEIFSCTNKDDAIDRIKYYTFYWDSLKSTRQAGKARYNTKDSQNLFEF